MGFDLVHAIPADDVDEIAAEMTYLQWKLGITQRLNEGMAAKFQKRIELGMRKERSRNLLMKKLEDAKAAHEAKINYTAMVTAASASHSELVTALAEITAISGSNNA